MRYLLSLLSILIFTTFSSAAEHQWKMATSWTGGPIMELGPKLFAERLEFLTEGRISIKVFPAGVLGKALQVSDTVRKGVADCGSTWAGYDWSIDKTAVLFGGFAGTLDHEMMIHWFYEAEGAKLQAEWRKEKFNLISYPLLFRTVEVFVHSKKPVSKLEDLKGLKLRTAGAWLEISKQLGAASISTSGGDVYPMLERGVIDATEWGTLYENITPGFHRITKYVVIPGVHQPYGGFELIINPEAWEKLSERDKKLVELAAKLVNFEGWTKYGHEDAKAYKEYLEAGNEIIELDAEVQRKARELGNQWAEKQAQNNVWFSKVLKSQREFEELWSKADSYRRFKK